MTTDEIENARNEMDAHLGLSIFKTMLEREIEISKDSDKTNQEILIYKLALSEANRIQQMLYFDVISDAEVSEILYNHEKFDQIMENI